MTTQEFQALSPATLAGRLGQIDAVRTRLGDPQEWRMREVGDGNLNLVFIVDGPGGSVVVKQALPYVRLVGESWPLPLKRAFFEYNALTRQNRRDPGSVPEIYYFDEGQAIIAMEFLSPHVILRKSLMAGTRHAGLGGFLGRFCARTLFRGSDLSLPTAERKADLALFAGNVELCDITENLVFSDPYFAAELNRHTPQLDPIVTALRADTDLKIAAQHLKMTFANNAETLLHGDLHTGSVMVTGDEARVIDPEFATYGPMGFDIGMLIANFLMAYCAQPGHAEAPGARAEYQEWILSVVDEIWTSFTAEFTRLWRSERTGILYQASLFEDQGHGLASEQARIERLAAIWRDCLGFCGIEIHRRTLGLAHIAEYDEIADDAARAACEARGLMLGRTLAVARAQFTGMEEVLDLARRTNQEDYL
ncbi:S-methyl-5-thioribose kinase [Antarcticimicrobium luteum]|uniref:S-methyl-5-thioribose kinase n=1 Tax=Antarcticimicrobium luteum TaxID=2547397 RepID=A0A4R5VFN7_9RHOB|nr:S-methyl-5-thioribose kinase [Antarcticimicrobium luteum]TDK50666.1 S-methyl-5-thioribose kinase [Antarcticimicrobium luteum]